MNQTIYPIGIQNFEKIRKDGYLYIDKTALVYQLVTTGQYYFLSRPRRFGKSLLLSTLEAYFQGKKELFEGLAMEKLEKDWKEYPILHFDLNISQYDSPDSLYKILNDILSRYEDEYGTRPSEVTLPLRFAGIIDRAYRKTGQRAVILIDEYDKPLLQNLHDKEMQNRLRNMLKPFYGVLKTMDRAIRFALLTGVTKFGKISVFSDLNNLMDLSMDNRYVEICGITEKEIHAYLDDEVKELADTQMTTYEETCLKLKQRYDGYHFTAKSEGIYNPFSLLNTFAKMEFGDYWFETGTPSYLVELLKHTHYDLYEMANTETDADVLNSIDSTSNNPIPVIYQSGYLTIKGYDPEFGIYRLGFPNKEVEEGFVKYLLPFYTSIQASKTPFEIGQFVREIRSGNYDAFFHRLQSFFADSRRAKAGTRHGAALPERPLHRLQAGRPVHASGVPYLERAYRPRLANRSLCIYHGVQAQRNRRGGPAANRGERLRPTLRRRQSGGLQDRRELLCRDPQYREVAGWVKKSCFYPDILTLPIQYISYARRRYTSSGIEVYLLPKKASQVNN